MKLTKYKLGEILDVTRGASLSGEFYATEGKYIRLTCGNFDYQNNCFKENKSTLIPQHYYKIFFLST